MYNLRDYNDPMINSIVFCYSNKKKKNVWIIGNSFSSPFLWTIWSIGKILTKKNSCILWCGNAKKSIGQIQKALLAISKKNLNIFSTIRRSEFLKKDDVDDEFVAWFYWLNIYHQIISRSSRLQSNIHH